MATTTDDGNTPDDPDKKEPPRVLEPDLLNLAASLVDAENNPAAKASLRDVLSQLQQKARAEARERELAALRQQVVQSAGEVNNVFIGGYYRDAAPQPAPDKPSLAEQRQKFHFEFLNHSLKQAEWTFRLSVWFMTGGAAVILVGAVLALLHAGSPSHGYVPLVTSLTGALITVGGGALAVHARRARAHVTEQAQRIEDKIDADHQLETATTFINRVSDPDAKDRLNAAAAMKALNMQANQTMVNRLLPSDQPKEIEPGDTTE
ncbi:TRADD-N-associated membrane domain-containing protein [Streptomyces broussonetiae]|uniref:TRADD-N-associated membrane domain-containing protein n=1 Tax=Streptomyces broussonetiae TaxID=2686304 RepID=UPI001E50E18A|nr:hypothetical protein [Streptomyces broussonetiae]